MDRGLHAEGVKPPADKVWRPESLAAASEDRSGQRSINRQDIENHLKGVVPKSIVIYHRIFFGRQFAGDGTDCSDAQRLQNAWIAAQNLASEERRAKRQPSAPPPASKPGPLPPRPPRCFGRDADLATLVTLLAQPGQAAVVLLGEGGIGKTTLAARLLHEPAMAEAFGRRVWHADLTIAKTAADMQARIAAAMGYPEGTDFPFVVDQLRTATAKARGVLSLDNLETAWNDTDRQAVSSTLVELTSVQGLVLLATFRGRVAPEPPAWAAHPVGRLTPPHDREAFISYANGKFADDPHLPDFLAALRGWPLQIRLVASRARVYPNLAGLWAEWQRRGPAAVAVDHDPMEPRQGSMSEVVAFSWASPKLAEPTRRLFRLLGALPAGMAASDREALLGADARRAAEQLVAAALAEWAAPGQIDEQIDERIDERIDLDPAIRDVALREYAPDSADRAWLAQHYSALASEAGPKLRQAPTAAASLSRLVLERANIEAAFDAAIAAGEPGWANEAMIILADTRFRIGVNDVAVFQRVLDAAPGLPLTRALALRAMARVQWFAARKQAKASLAKAETLFAEEGDDLGHARCLLDRADLDSVNDRAAARDGYAAAAALYAQRGDDLGRARCLLGRAELDRINDPAAAREGYAAAAALYAQLGHDFGRADCLLGRAELDRVSDDPAAAREGYAAAAALYARLGADLGRAHCFAGRAELDRINDRAAARDGYAAAAALYAQRGDDLGRARCLLGRAELDRINDPAAAREGYAAAAALYAQLGSDLGRAHCLHGRADLDSVSDPAAARDGYTKAEALYAQRGDDLGRANCFVGLAELAETRRDKAEACQRYAEAYALFKREGGAKWTSWIDGRRRALGCKPA